MSENLDLVRSLYADWERGDWSLGQWAHPEIEFVITGGPSPGSWTGVAAMAEAWRDFLGAWEGYCVSVDEYRELDEGRVLVLDRQGGRGKASGIQLEDMQAKKAALFHIREGKVTRLVYYWDRDPALAELGLAE
jgi:ketosteroid isomerase-like protein